MVVIQSINWRIHPNKNAFLGFSGENNTEDFYIVPSEMEDYTYTVDCQNSGNKAFFGLEKTTYGDKQALHVLLTAGQIGASGKVQMQLVGRNSVGVAIKKSNIFILPVGESIDSASGYADLPASAFEEYVAKAGESADSASASAEAAKISEDNAKVSEEAFRYRE